MKRIGITGASGFVGGALIAEATERGDEVVGFSRNPDRQIEGCTEVRGFSADNRSDLSGLDALVHLAGSSILGLWTPGKKREIRESRVRTTEDIVDALFAMDAEQRPRVFACASAVGFYGDRGDEWLDEESDAGFGFLAEVCKQWESTAARAENFGIRVIHLRIGFVLGQDGGAIPLMEKVFGMGLGGNLGNGRQWMPWIHIADVAGIIHTALDHEAIRGAVNVTGPEPAQNRELTEKIASTLGKPRALPVPSFVIKALPGGMHEMFLSSLRVDPTVMKSHGYEWKHPTLSSALKAAL